MELCIGRAGVRDAKSAFRKIHSADANEHREQWMLRVHRQGDTDDNDDDDDARSKRDALDSGAKIISYTFPINFIQRMNAYNCSQYSTEAILKSDERKRERKKTPAERKKTNGSSFFTEILVGFFLSSFFHRLFSLKWNGIQTLQIISWCILQ